MKIYGDENNAFLLKEMGERIRDIRIAQNLTQEEMADRLARIFANMPLKGGA